MSRLDAESAKEVAEGKTVGVIQVNEAEVKAHLGEMVRQSVEETLNGMLDACPDPEWRTIFALARFGGLRVPSEILGLTWQDIDWAGGRFTVHSPKTEHHPGGESRVVPLFPELLPHLQQVFEQAAPGAEYVITRYRRSNQNLSTQLRRIIRRAVRLALWGSKSGCTIRPVSLRVSARACSIDTSGNRPGRIPGPARPRSGRRAVGRSRATG